ncbi:uncharacterized protein LOC126841274 [Adelges cooleyi]|uniref:uncharacterized protein LOC126841274 n=1 Tax=Adelges cooleyi TaxID=133065 RepID=UPI00218026B3|nr:uncharacterized protein LOC126841274 [Adelges cooleyi]
MHLKSALIVCAVFFLSSAWGEGLTLEQIETFVTFYKAHFRENINTFSLEEGEELFQQLGINTMRDSLKAKFIDKKPARELLMASILVAVQDTKFEENESRMRFDRAEVEQSLHVFGTMDPGGTGLITPDEYADYVKALKTLVAVQEIHHPERAEKTRQAKEVLNKFDGVTSLNLAEFIHIAMCLTDHLVLKPTPGQ